MYTGVISGPGLRKHLRRAEWALRRALEAALRLQLPLPPDPSHQSPPPPAPGASSPSPFLSLSVSSPSAECFLPPSSAVRYANPLPAGFPSPDSCDFSIGTPPLCLPCSPPVGTKRLASTSRSWCASPPSAKSPRLGKTDLALRTPGRDLC